MTATAAASAADETGRVLAFAATIFRRADGIEDVVPRGFAPDWRDRPAMFRCYEDAERLALPSPATLPDRYARVRSGRRGVADNAALSTLLFLTTAPLRRKLELSWNAQDPPPGFNQQDYRRGSASGGGLYPTQVYVVAGDDSGGVAPGIYHYSCGHHALTPLRRGDHRATVAQALPDTLQAAGVCLVLTSDFWQNCFKYHNFGYHVCSQDVGAVIATTHLVAEAFGLPHRVHLAFDDDALERLLGVGKGEGVLAVIALGRAAVDPPRRALPVLPVARPRQRSKAVRIPPELMAMHDATRCPRPSSPPQAEHVVADRFDEALFDTLPQVLMRRRSAWGSLSTAPLPVAKLVALLDFMNRRREAGGVLRESLPDASAMELVFQANAVDGLPRGAYRWNPAARTVEPIDSAPPSRWQSTYSMLNYNIDTARCALFITGDLSRLVAAYGPAGYRILNAHVGLLAQLAYTGAAALDLECGVVLGVCAQKVKACLALAPGHEVLLAVYVSGRAPDVELFDFRFVPETRA